MSIASSIYNPKSFDNSNDVDDLKQQIRILFD
jgi:hypothetical protein